MHNHWQFLKRLWDYTLSIQDTNKVYWAKIWLTQFEGDILYWLEFIQSFKPKDILKQIKTSQGNK